MNNVTMETVSQVMAVTVHVWLSKVTIASQITQMPLFAFLTSPAWNIMRLWRLWIKKIRLKFTSHFSLYSRSTSITSTFSSHCSTVLLWRLKMTSLPTLLTSSTITKTKKSGSRSDSSTSRKSTKVSNITWGSSSEIRTGLITCHKPYNTL